MSLSQHQMLQALMNKSHGGALIGGALSQSKAARAARGESAKSKPTAESKAQTHNLRKYQATNRENRKAEIKAATAHLKKSAAEHQEVADTYNILKPGSGDHYLASINRLASGQAAAKATRAFTAQVKDNLRDKGYTGFKLKMKMVEYAEAKSKLQRGEKGEPSITSAQAQNAMGNWIASVPITSGKAKRIKGFPGLGSRGPRKPKAFGDEAPPRTAAERALEQKE